MQHTTLSINGRSFLLSPDRDVGELQRTATEAMRAGGGVLEFTATGDHNICIVITHGVPVIFDTIDTEAGDPAAGDATYPFSLELGDY
jgi:hypothetical protein